MATTHIEFSCTTVPTSMRSPYWKYFGFPSDNSKKILTREKIICTLCNKAIAYNKNTSNLRTHLIAKHVEILQEIQMQQQNSSVDSSGGQRKRQRADSAAKSENKELLKYPDIYDGDVSLSSHHTDEVLDIEAGSGSDGDEFLVDVFKTVENGNEKSLCNPQNVEILELRDNNTVQNSTLNSNVIFADLVTEQCDSNVHDDADDDDDDGTAGTEDDAQPFTLVNFVQETLQPPASYADMLISDLLPVSTLKGVAFQRLLAPGVDLKKIEHELRTRYNNMQHSIELHVQKISQSENYTLGFECYKSIEGLEVVNIYLHYLAYEEDHAEFNDVLYHSLESSADLITSLNTCLQALNLKNCAAFICSRDCALEIETLAGLNEIPLMTCFEVLLSNCLTKIFDGTTADALFQQAFELLRNEAQKTMLNLPKVYDSVPWSKLDFLQHMLVISLLKSINVDLSDRLLEFVHFIQPLGIILKTIAEEPLPLCTLIRPLVLKLLNAHFAVPSSQDVLILETKEIIIDYLTNSIIKDVFLREATFFDARFQHDFIESQSSQRQQLGQEPAQQRQEFGGRVDVKQSICKRFKRLIEATNIPKPAVKSEQSESATNDRRRSNLKSFFNRITHSSGGDNSGAQQAAAPQKKTNIEVEFDKYECESTLDLEQCPISWWQEHAYKYKQLRKIANYYMCVPCCVNQLYRHNAKERVNWLNKRFMLRQQHDAERHLWYLHYNKRFYDKIMNL